MRLILGVSKLNFGLFCNIIQLFRYKIFIKDKFAASISFAGDNTYEKVSKNVKITIK